MKPPWFNASASYFSSTQADLSISVFIDIDSHEKINFFAYESQHCEILTPFLSALVEILPGMTVEQVYDSGMEIFDQIQENPPFLPLPLILTKKALENYLGLPAPLNEQLGKKGKTDGILCRCFGVYKEEIKTFLQGHPESQLRDVTINLRAGGGCTSCSKDIQKLIDEVEFSKSPKSTQPLSLNPHARQRVTLGPRKLTPVQLAIEAQPLIDQWVLDKFPERPELQIYLMKIEQERLFFQVRPQQDKEILAKMVDSLRISLGWNFLFTDIDDLIEFF